MRSRASWRRIAASPTLHGGRMALGKKRMKKKPAKPARKKAMKKKGGKKKKR